MPRGEHSLGREGPSGADAMTFGDLDVGSLSAPMRRLVKALMLYKSMFAGPWFQALTEEEDPKTRAVYDRIRLETGDQARRAFDLLERWDASADRGRAGEVTEQVLKRLLEDMLSLKKSSTEVFLGAGISSPNETMRRAFLDLADIDRQHAEALREALGVHLPDDTAQLPAPPRGYAGVHPGPFRPGGLSDAIRSALDAARHAGHEPTRIIMSSMALRHLRDEGSVAPRQGDVFGLPVDVDFSWEHEAFVIASRTRISLAEIVTEMEASEAPHPHDG